MQTARRRIKTLRKKLNHATKPPTPHEAEALAMAIDETQDSITRWAAGIGRLVTTLNDQNVPGFAKSLLRSPFGTLVMQMGVIRARAMQSWIRHKAEVNPVERVKRICSQSMSRAVALCPPQLIVPDRVQRTSRRQHLQAWKYPCNPRSPLQQYARRGSCDAS